MEPAKCSTHVKHQPHLEIPQPANSSSPQNLRSFQPLVNGALAGALEVSLMHPTLVWKNCRQLRQPVPLSFKALYQGFPLSLSLSIPMFALMHGTNKIIIDSMDPSPYSQAVGTLSAAANTTLSLNAVEALVIQKNYLNSSWSHIVRKIWREHKIAVLTRGSFESFSRNFAYCYGMYKCSEPLARFLRSKAVETKREVSPEKVQVLAAVLSGGLVGFLAHPFDTVKTVLQKDLGRVRYRNGFVLARLAWSKYGISWFYRGMIPHLVRFSVGAGLFSWATRKLEGHNPTQSVTSFYPTQSE